MHGVRRIATLLCAGSLFIGCGSDRPGFASDANKIDSGTSNASGGGGTDGGASGNASIPDDGINVAIGSGGVPQINESCLSEVREAERVDVDLFIMLDRSSSMNASIQNGSTKWDAITSALASFAADPGTADIGIGLQYFPQHKLDVPTECREDANCGDNGPCLITGSCASRLLEAGSECYSAANCPPRDRCATVGLCADNQDFACSPAGSTCQDDQDYNFGACVRWAGHCAKQDSCDPFTYGVPQIPIMVGADRGEVFADSIANNAPLGDTPTAPALQGAIDYAHTWAEAHPTHVVVVVLATDGLPSECSAANNDGVILIEPIAAIAQTAAGGAPAIRTFVVGVFSAEDTRAPGNLDTIAKAGATDSAFIIDTEGDVLLDFFTALDSIRSTALACDFKLANQTSENPLNYELVNLSFDNGHDKPTQLINVKDSAGCADKDHDGWYYVTEAGSQTPTQISVCPGVCDDFKSTNGGSVKLQIGCQTIVR